MLLFCNTQGDRTQGGKQKGSQSKQASLIAGDWRWVNILEISVVFLCLMLGQGSHADCPSVIINRINAGKGTHEAARTGREHVSVLHYARVCLCLWVCVWEYALSFMFKCYWALQSTMHAHWYITFKFNFWNDFSYNLSTIFITRWLNSGNERCKHREFLPVDEQKCRIVIELYMVAGTGINYCSITECVTHEIFKIISV